MFTSVRLFFRTLSGDPIPDPPEFDADRAMNDPELLEARERARHGDWQAARAAIEAAGTDWELRGRRVGVFSDLAAADDRWLYAWLSAAPSDPTAVLIQAAMLGQRAGEARGSAAAADTSAEQFAGFQQLSQASAQVGERAIALAGAGDPLPWVEMLGTMFADRHARALSADEVFEQGRRRDPYNFDLHWTVLSLRCKKWGGSHELMFATAREVAEAAPSGHSSVLLPLFAHFEYALLEFGWSERTDQTRKVQRRYFTRPEVRQELDHWIAKWRAGTPGPAKLSTCRQWQALYYSLAGRRAEAKAVFDELGQYVVPTTGWGYFWPGGEYGYLKAWMWANRI